MARCFFPAGAWWAWCRRGDTAHVSEWMHTDLILTAFNRAMTICQPPPGLLVHTDRGS